MKDSAFGSLSVWQAVEQACNAAKRLIEDVDIPTLQVMGFAEEEIPLLARIAFEDRQIVGNPRYLTEEAYV